MHAKRKQMFKTALMGHENISPPLFLSSGTSSEWHFFDVLVFFGPIYFFPDRLISAPSKQLQTSRHRKLRLDYPLFRSSELPRTWGASINPGSAVELRGEKSQKTPLLRFRIEIRAKRKIPAGNPPRFQRRITSDLR